MAEPVSISNAIAKKTFSSNAHLPIHEFESDVNLTDLDLFTNGQPFDEFKKTSKKNKTFVIAGGVAANKGIRKKLISVCKKNNFKPIFPEPKLCGDNAAMIALVGLEKYKIKKFDNLDLPASPRLPLDAKAKFLKGAGVKL